MLLNLVVWLDTLILHDAFMTKVLNSLGMNSNNFYPKWVLSQFLHLHSILRVIVLLKCAQVRGHGALYTYSLTFSSNMVEAQAVVKQALSTAMHATHCAFHGSLLNLYCSPIK